MRRICAFGEEGRRLSWTSDRKDEWNHDDDYDHDYDYDYDYDHDYDGGPIYLDFR
jgi:hypothetical protein